MKPTPTITNIGSIIFVCGMIQFINVMDFMMVMPMGPDFARALNIPLSDIGKIGGAYTLAAAIMGLASALFIDDFARKPAILTCLGGLILATFAGGFAWNESSLIAARMLAGAFGGPLTSLSLAFIADVTTPDKRGSAMGKVMGGFAAASVFGVPFGLELAEYFSWRAPFTSTALMGVGVWMFAAARLPYYPSLVEKQNVSARISALAAMLRNRLALQAYLMIALAMFAGFMIIPNISTHIQINLHYPRARIGLLYLLGGVVSFVGMRLAGKLTDRTSSTFTISIFTALLIAVMLAGFVFYTPATPVILLFPLFMVAMSGRMICAQTLSSRIPRPQDRGAYMSVQSSCMQLASAIGAYVSSNILIQGQDQLLHVPTVAMIAIVASAIIPLICWRIESRLVDQPMP